MLSISRRPDSILNPQFWSEDGRVWYADAYNHGGLQALLIPHTGYLQTLPRLVAAGSLIAPLSVAPLIFNVCAILIQSLPVMMFCSSRFDEVIPSLWKRMVLAFLYMTTASGTEIGANITNSQWHVAFLMFTVLIAKPPRRRAWKTFDALVLIIGGLTGPFVLILLPLYVVYALFKRKLSLLHLVTLGLPFLVQLCVVLTSASSTRFTGDLGAGLIPLVQILSGQVVTTTSVGIVGYFVLHSSAWGHIYLPLALFLIGAALTALALWKGSAELRFFILFAWATLGAVLISPGPGTGNGVMPAWQGLAEPATNMRYFFLPILAWLAVLTWTLTSSTYRSAKLVSFALLALALLVGIPLDWHEAARVNMHFQHYVAEFNKVPPGTAFNFPQNPPTWKAPMTLVKH